MPEDTGDAKEAEKQKLKMEGVVGLRSRLVGKWRDLDNYKKRYGDFQPLAVKQDQNLDALYTDIARLNLKLKAAQGQELPVDEGVDMETNKTGIRQKLAALWAEKDALDGRALSEMEYIRKKELTLHINALRLDLTDLEEATKPPSATVFEAPWVEPRTVLIPATGPAGILHDQDEENTGKANRHEVGE